MLITEDQVVPNELHAQCRSHGLARNVVYAVMAVVGTKLVWDGLSALAGAG